MTIKEQIFLFLLSISLHLAASLSEVCFFHNTTADGAYLQCGDLIASEKLPLYQEHLEIQSIQIGWNTTIPVLDYGLFTRFRNLQNLSLSNANIEKIGPRAFYDMEYLRELNLYNNKISKIESAMFTQLYILRVLNLGENNIETLGENTFSSIYQLEQLILRWNNIHNVTKATFNGLGMLLLLDLRGNRIETLNGDVFEDLHSLESLDLSFNALKEIPSMLFSNQENLVTLTLESNNLKSLPDKLFQNTTYLQFFDVSNNLLTYFQENALNTTAVEILKFSRNHISTINATRLLLNMELLDKVDLDFNPWNCNSLKMAINELQKSQVYLFEPVTQIEDMHHVQGIACKHATNNIVDEPSVF